MNSGLLIGVYRLAANGRDDQKDQPRAVEGRKRKQVEPAYRGVEHGQEEGQLYDALFRYLVKKLHDADGPLHALNDLGSGRLFIEPALENNVRRCRERSNE